MLLPNIPWVGGLFIILFSLPGVIGTLENLGRKKGLLFILGLSIFATVFEFLAVKTGFPYGYFWYGDVLLPKIAGTVPLFVSLAWLPIFLGASALANRAGVPRGVPFMLTVALIMLAVDLVVDPGAVAEGFWAFRNGGEYFGVPVANFVGWLFMGSFAAFLFPNNIKSEKAVAGLLAVVMFWTVMAIMHGLVWPALVGLAFVLGTSWFDLRKRGWRS